jgi:excisionase family DNA binding protein
MKNDSIFEFLTIYELSKWIRLSRSHIYFLVSKKKIPFIKLGGKLLFNAIEIRIWIEQSSCNLDKAESTAQRGRPKESSINRII